MKLVGIAIPLLCAAALFGCSKNDRTGQTTTRSAADRDRTAAPSSTVSTTTTTEGPYVGEGSTMGTSPGSSPGSTTTTPSPSPGTSTTSPMGGDTTGSAMRGIPLGYQSATARIIGARCDRVVACNQIGTNRRFATRDVCAREQAQKTQDELKSTDCPNDIDPSKLQSCLTSIAQQTCSQLTASLQTIDACQTSALCR